ncbi:MAG: TIGR00153 family protein [Calditrichaeota bacterium]|nr:TIGR00153 family protein [Calditrichota bacterium]
MPALFDVFSESPFRKLVIHMEKIKECSTNLEPLFKAVFEQNQTELKRIHDRVFELENDADQIKNSIRDHLPKSIFLPVDRGDLLHYLHLQDNIADAIQDVSVLLSLKFYPLPKEMHSDVMDLAKHSAETCQVFAECVTEFSNLIEASFGKKETKKVMDLISEVGIKEFEADKLKYSIVRTLLDKEKEIGAIGIMMWMKVIDELDNISNYSESTANKMRSMIAKT